MKLGLHLYDFSWPAGASQLGPTLVQIAQAAETAGFDRISTIDHVWQSHYLGGPEHEVPSCYPTLTYLAAHTSRVKLLALATGSPYWHPILLAKTVTTLDVLSGGRAWLSIGAGDYEEEAVGSGLPFPPLKERYEQLEEILQPGPPSALSVIGHDDAVQTCCMLYADERGVARIYQMSLGRCSTRDAEVTPSRSP
jgi:alkanesulfonate monooxygenase SsuD/methylene tetrahydromethanopterin reductase-like flavin-dependent oxidoreductase (luciferase family)